VLKLRVHGQSQLSWLILVISAIYCARSYFYQDSVWLPVRGGLIAIDFQQAICRFSWSSEVTALSNGAQINTRPVHASDEVQADWKLRLLGISWCCWSFPKRQTWTPVTSYLISVSIWHVLVLGAISMLYYGITRRSRQASRSFEVLVNGSNPAKESDSVTSPKE
jgi:hypothetical protein